MARPLRIEYGGAVYQLNCQFSRADPHFGSSYVEDSKLKEFKPKIVLLDEGNKIFTVNTTASLSEKRIMC